MKLFYHITYTLSHIYLPNTNRIARELIKEIESILEKAPQLKILLSNPLDTGTDLSEAQKALCTIAYDILQNTEEEQIKNAVRLIVQLNTNRELYDLTKKTIHTLFEEIKTIRST